MKQGSEIKARPLSEFAETETPDDWLSVYSSTKTVEELLGLLHEGAKYVKDERVLDIYLAYAGEQNEDKAVKKARAILFRHILPSIIDLSPVEKEFDSNSNMWKIKGRHLEKTFAFFMDPGRFPDQQPFKNDVYIFLEHYAETLRYAAGTNGPSVPLELWSEFRFVLMAALKSKTGERYDDLVRQLLRRGEPVRRSFEPVLVKELRREIVERNGVIDPLCSEQVLCEHGIEHGGFERRMALLLRDMRSKNSYKLL